MQDPVLQCSICPGQPEFSDVSHLLTHAASKAHLANHFRLKLRADDDNAVELLRQYDEWFDSNGFAKQLAARMANKESRKKRKSDEASISDAGKRTRSQAPNVEPESSNTPATTTTSGPDCLDPRLADSQDDQQHAGTILTPTTPSRLPMANNNATSRTGPTLRPMRYSNGAKLNVLQPMHASGLGDETRSLALPVTPIQRRHRPEPLERTSTSSRDTPDPFIDSGDQTQVSGDTEIDKTRAEEMARLKGVQWPGMDIFDSATVQMRRRRNQKKDSAVLKMMELTSSLVEPNEMVFSSEGTLLKEREITGNVEEYSPLKGETPIPRRSVARTKTTRLTKADPNVPRAADRKRQKIDKDRKNVEELVREEQDSPRRSRRAAARTHSYVGDDEEFGFTVNTFGKRPRGGFNVFIDGEQEGEDSKPSYHEPGFKTQLDTLTPTRLVLNGKTNTGIHASRFGHTSVYKENIEPILNPNGRIGPHDWHSPFAKRINTDEFGLGPPYFSDIGDSYDNFDKAGYRFNPLQAPSNHPFYDTQYEEEHDASHNGWLSMEQTALSEETLSEEDQMLQSYYLSADAN
ncbi:Terpenoid cyclases/protein prenyltransferase alpha-alpha toroid [Penicillium cf. griseofulvum]|nr:Terpenoid cyclases/protein prenyltransferase alpha-alpha toroid [Penicillium cf. griseofulvum]